MVSATQAYNAYQNANVYEGMDPNRLILMLYEGALQHLELTREGILAGDVKKRGEHLGRVIAIITELSAALDSNVKEEPIEFLRGLYRAMLMELPQVTITNDVGIIDLVHKYLSFLRDTWKDNVMKDNPRMNIAPGQAEKSESACQPLMPNRTAKAYANAGRLNGISFSV